MVLNSHPMLGCPMGKWQGWHPYLEINIAEQTDWQHAKTTYPNSYQNWTHLKTCSEMPQTTMLIEQTSLMWAPSDKKTP